MSITEDPMVAYEDSAQSYMALLAQRIRLASNKSIDLNMTYRTQYHIIQKVYSIHKHRQPTGAIAVG